MSTRRLQPVVRLREVRKSFRDPDGRSLEVLRVRAFDLEAGAQLGLHGPSGSGKTTLLHILAGLTLPEAGTVEVAGSEITRLKEAHRDRHRAEHLGYVLQTIELLPGFSALENVMLAMRFASSAGGGTDSDRERAAHLLKRVGLAERLHHRPDALSLGQQQRVAVARALANRPRLVLADEPTGSLDATRRREALALIQETCREEAAALLLVSHDEAVLEPLESVIALAAINEVVAPAT